MRQLVAAWDSRAAGTGVITVNGNLVEELHVKEVMVPQSCSSIPLYVYQLKLQNLYCFPSGGSGPNVSRVHQKGPRPKMKRERGISISID